MTASNALTRATEIGWSWLAGLGPRCVEIGSNYLSEGMLSFEHSLGLGEGDLEEGDGFVESAGGQVGVGEVVA
jgi:hypothetical protein